MIPRFSSLSRYNDLIALLAALALLAAMLARTPQSPTPTFEGLAGIPAPARSA